MIRDPSATKNEVIIRRKKASLRRWAYRTAHTLAKHRIHLLWSTRKIAVSPLSPLYDLCARTYQANGVNAVRKTSTAGIHSPRICQSQRFNGIATTRRGEKGPSIKKLHFIRSEHSSHVQDKGIHRNKCSVNLWIWNVVSSTHQENYNIFSAGITLVMSIGKEPWENGEGIERNAILSRSEWKRISGRMGQIFVHCWHAMNECLPKTITQPPIDRFISV